MCFTHCYMVVTTTPTKKYVWFVGYDSKDSSARDSRSLIAMGLLDVYSVLPLYTPRPGSCWPATGSCGGSVAAAGDTGDSSGSRRQ